MTHIYTCSICDSEFKNSRSLYSHNYKYHPNTSKSTTGRELYSNKTNSEAGESSLYEFDFHKNKAMLIKYIERLPKLARITGDVLDDVKDLKKAVREKQKQNDTSDNRVMSMMLYIERLPKLLHDVKDLEKEMSEIQNRDLPQDSEMLGSGVEDRNKIEELSDDIDILFIKMLDFEDNNKKKAERIEYMEKAIDNTLQMIDLFKNRMYSDIKYKIKELRNAAFFTLKIMKRANTLGKDN